MTDRTVTAVEVGLRYLSLGHRMRRVVDDGMAHGGLSLARTKVLQVLQLQGPLRQASLAEALSQAPRSVTQSLEALERDGFVERTSDPEDGRSKLVRLTPQGSKALATGTAAGERVLSEIFAKMTAEQLAELGRLLDVIDRGLEV
ncbi:DNA-binding MarR family transcriptional regulator [Psychromicrobium silvestre]|uniref:DNA-binding MarR family transcriptional regulator n=1 Tax=Psychromicrobium silvestre TaxID=1645614 RepID=A0A7Y9LUN3_9MICC|nr:MarR family transcriptional regulator [Psychromicrobium silvestre]NYE95911.1 DNA-binding MarR family transcriptional regulator [Psychromicrobium silvestre]